MHALQAFLTIVISTTSQITIHLVVYFIIRWQTLLESTNGKLGIITANPYYYNSIG